MKKVTDYMIALAGVFLILWLSGYFSFLAFVTNYPSAPDQKTDAIVVVTGGAGRIRTGLELLASGWAPKLLISGVDETVSDAEIYSMWDGDKRPLDCCMTLGREATNTKGNAAEAGAWVQNNGFRSLRLVTSNYHIPRTQMEFRQVMPGISMLFHPAKTPDSEKNHLKYLYIAFMEYNKMLITYLQYRF
jgi:uncharacterized SAM-binding protein YcdF (DUF218 family)